MAFKVSVNAVWRSKRVLKDLKIVLSLTFNCENILNSRATSDELKTTNRTLIEHRIKERIVTRIDSDKNLESDG